MKASRTHATHAYCSAPASKVQGLQSHAARAASCLQSKRSSSCYTNTFFLPCFFPSGAARLHAACQQHPSARPLFMPVGLDSVTQRILASHGPYLQQLRRARQACPAPRCTALSCRRPFFHIHHPLCTSQCLLAHQTLCTSLQSMTEETSSNIRSIPAAQKCPPALPCVPLCCACQQQRSLSSTSVVHTALSPGALWLLLS